MILLLALHSVYISAHATKHDCYPVVLCSPNRTVLKFLLFPSLQCHTFLLVQPILTELRPAMTTLMSRRLQCLGCLLCSNITVGALESQ